MFMKEQIKKMPVIGDWIRSIYWKFKKNHQVEFSSSKYWEDRYASGNNSGAGSYNKFAEFKAEILNAFVAEHGVNTVIEFGCGDGNQLELANYPNYIGFDVSETVVALCKKKFSSDASKAFKLMCEYDGKLADLSLSLDVIYHLIEDEVFGDYMRVLFKSAERYAIIYSSDFDENEMKDMAVHVRHRKFTQWIKENISDWKLVDYIENKYPYNRDNRDGSFANFYIYKKT